MKLARPVLISLSAAVVCGGAILFLPAISAQDAPLLGAAANNPTQGYLGVGMRDVDTERATQLKLKEVRGAEIITVDHDAPAAKAGLRVHDVILGMNNQPIDGQAQLTRMLHDTPAGRTVTLLISRDGQVITLTAHLADRATIEANAWSQHIPVPDPDTDGFGLPNTGMGNSFIPTLGSNPFYTGLDLDMLGPQLANYFGVHDGQGLLVKRVDDNSPGSAAGLRAGDVITKVNGQVMATTNQWMHVIHSNRGKQVQLTVIRDRKENVVPMMAGRGKAKSEVEAPEGMPGLALLSAPGPNFARQCGFAWFMQQAPRVSPAQFAQAAAERMHAVAAE
jgi:serine protease Do